MYTTLKEAKKEIRKRWNDKDLKKKVLGYIGSVPPVFDKEPRAVLARQVATPDFEFKKFINLAKETSLKPICLEYTQDKFSTNNHDKLPLGKMNFVRRKRGRKSWIQFSERKRIIDLCKFDNNKFCDIETLWGENFIDFHHRIFHTKFPGIEKYDASEWAKVIKKGKENLYDKFLALFLCHGVLFESFLANKNEERFTFEVVFLSFKKIKKIFGIEPLIVRLNSPEEEENPVYWSRYPSYVRKEIEKSLSN